MFTSAIAVLMLQAVGGIPTPPPPPPPPVADDTVVKNAIDRAVLCVDGDDGRGLADRATRGLQARIGTPQWKEARKIVLTYLARREDARQCIAALERVRFSTPMSSHDRKVLVNTEAGLIRFWLEQNVYATQITARLVGASIGSDIPVYITPTH